MTGKGVTGKGVTGSGASGTSLAAPQLDALTGIRGLAAWAVVLFHLRVSLLSVLPGWAMAVAAKGYLAVDLFFMLSGFVLWYNYAERLRTGGWAATAQFWWRRIARIWPLHFVILTLFVGSALLAVLRGHDGGHYPFAQLPLHYLLVQNWGFTRELAWNDPAWSISTEVAAYILFPAVVMACRWERLGWPALAAIAALLLLALDRLIAGSGHASLGADIPALGLRRCLIEFALGNIVCIVWQGWRHHPATAPLAALAALSALAIGLTLGAIEAAFVPAMFAAALLALAADRGPVARLLSAPGLVYLGEISYSTYLAHYLLFTLVKLVFAGADLQISLFALALYAGAVLAASVVLYHGLEKPAQRWLNARQPRLARNRAPAQA